MIVTYAEGWDKYSKKTAEAMLEAEPVKKALGKAVVIKFGVPNVSGKKDHEKNKARFGNADINFPNSYPAFVFYDKTGHRVADLCINFHDRKKPKVVAQQIKEIMDASAQQQALLAKAEKASGVERATLLGQAARIPGLRRPNNVAKLIQEADPGDKSGMYKMTTMNLFDKAIETAKTENWEATLNEMKQMMNNPLLTSDQQQQLCCICIGLLHRHGGMKHKGELKTMIDKLEQLNPESILGKSAADARRLWVKDLTLAEGWNPDVIPNTTTPVEVVGDIPMKEAGTYSVVFTYTNGSHAAQFAAVELYDGNKKVAEDRHSGSSGERSANNIYTLKVPGNVGNPKLFVTFDMGENRSSYGQITIIKK